MTLLGMEKVIGAVIICAVVLALDMAAGILAILAQDARNKVRLQSQLYFCYFFLQVLIRSLQLK
jgi:hypothetical protein